MLTEILQTAVEKCGLKAGQTVLVGVSGGPDSLCLLDALSKLGFDTIAAYFNHQLRAEADTEEGQVEHIASSLQIHFVSGKGDVAAAVRETGKSIEQAAREMRYAFLFASAREHGADAVAVGHNADDQVETILMHMLRGSGLAGMRGMAFRAMTQWDDRIPLVRPLLGLWRSEILDYFGASGLQPSLDASNLERLYFRNRIRLDLIPELEALAPGARQRIWNLSQLAADELQLLEVMEGEAWRNCVREQGPGRIHYDLTALRNQSEVMQRRLIRHGAAVLRPLGDGLSLENTLRAVSYLQAGAPGRKIELEGHLLLGMTTDGLLLSDRDYPIAAGLYPCMPEAESLPIEMNGWINLGAGWKLFAEEGAPPEGADLQQPRNRLQLDTWLDADALTGPLSLRRAQPGDRFQPLGMQTGSQKLSDFWINHKIPANARKAWPVLVCSDEILWVPGFAPGHRARIRPETKHSIHLTLRREK